MDRILKILKKENGPRASSAPALELNTIIFKHVYWYMQQISGERLQDHWSSGFFFGTPCNSPGSSFAFRMYMAQKQIPCKRFSMIYTLQKKFCTTSFFFMFYVTF